MQRFADLPEGLAQGEDGCEADQAEDGADEGPGEGHQPRYRGGCLRRDGGLVALEAYLAQDQAYALAHSGADAEQDSLQGQLQRQLMRFASPVENGIADTGEGDQHRQPRVPRHGLAQHQPAGYTGNWRGERHEKLSVARAEYDIGVEQAVVSEDIPYDSGKGEPEPCPAVCEARVGCSGENPKENCEKGERHRHPDQVQGQRPYPVAGDVGEQSRSRP